MKTDALVSVERLREALNRIKSFAVKLRRGTDDWFDLVEIECMADAALQATPSLQTGGEGAIDAAAARMAAVNGMDWHEQCAIEAGADECNSSTCIAAHDEDHDPDQCRALYRSLARAAFASGVEGETVPSIPADGWRTALHNALGANVPVGTVDARTRDAIICNVVDAFQRSLGTSPSTTGETVPGDEVERLIGWIDEAIDLGEKSGNTHGIWLFARQWKTVRAALAASPKPTIVEASGMVERRRIIAEARKNLALTQGCLECNADDERRWMDTIAWLESLA